MFPFPAPDATIEAVILEIWKENVAEHTLCCVQEESLGLVCRNRRDGQYPLGVGWMSLAQLDCLLLLYLERSQIFGKGELPNEISSIY